jgi:hypothetical protein
VTTFSNPRLTERLKAHSVSPDLLGAEVETGLAVSLGPASQIEIVDDQLGCWLPFVGAEPDEHWLRLFREASSDWPSHLVEPQLDEDRGVWFGPFPVNGLDEHAHALKRRVEDVNLVYQSRVVPELRRQYEEAVRLEAERRQVRAHVEGQLRELFG